MLCHFCMIENKKMIKFLKVLLLFTCSISFGQTAILKVHKVFPNSKENINHIKFIINEQSFGEKDTIIAIKINKNGFDNCCAIIYNDTLNFKTKFQENEVYKVEQGCCCAAFTLTAEKNPHRGTIKFKNQTKRSLGLIIAEANVEKIGSGKTKDIYALESAMCMFKPCSILVTEKEYLSDKYDYKSDNIDYNQLSKEQKKYEIALIWFHFLHGEKVEIFYNEKTKKLDLNLIGYLTEEEFKKVSQ